MEAEKQMSAIDFYELNYQLGVLLFNAQSNQDIEVLKKLIRALNGRYILEKIKEGYMCSYLPCNNVSNIEKEMQFSQQLDALKLHPAFSIPTTPTGESLYNYIGKEVMVTDVMGDNYLNSLEVTLKSIVFNPINSEYEIVLVDKSLKVFNHFLCYCSDIIVIPLDQNS